jgi:hypothetical protein
MERLLGGAQVAGLQRLADRFEGPLARAHLEWISIGEWATLAEILDRLVLLLRGSEIAGSNRLA